jgi:hypothetical protein
MDLNFRFPDAAVCRPRRKQGFFRPQHDEQLVQVQRTRRIAGSERDDAGNLPVDPGRDPHIAGSDFLGGDPEGGGHQRHELHIVAHTAFERKQRSDSAADELRSGPGFATRRVY